MKNTTIRISETLLDNIKLLKATTNESTYENLLSKIVKSELKKSYAYTKNGYLGVGTVVKDKDTVLVIKEVTQDKVVFNDGTSAINGSATVYNLDFLSDTISQYKGERSGT